MPGIQFEGYGYKALHHLLLNNAFEAVMYLEDALLNMLLGEIVTKEVAGQTLIQKLLMDDTFELMATGKDNYAFDVNPGTPRIVDATIKERTLSGRFMVDGNTIANLRAAPPEAAAIRLEDLRLRYQRMLKANMHRILAGDGTGRRCYLGAASGTATMVLVDEDGSTALHASHPAWKAFIPGKHVDVVNAATGIVVEGGADRTIVSVSKSGSTMDLDEALTVTGSKAYYIRMYSPLSDTTNRDYRDSTFALQPEPLGLEGIITSAASLLGYSSEDYPSWFTPAVDCGGAAASLASLDELFAQMEIEDGTICVGDSACISQLRIEAEGKKLLLDSEKASDFIGVKDIKYQSLIANQQEVPLLTSREFNGKRKLFFLPPKVIQRRGSLTNFKWVRNQLVPSETYSQFYDDVEAKFEIYPERRACMGLLYNVGAAYGWNKVSS